MVLSSPGENQGDTHWSSKGQLTREGYLKDMDIHERQQLISLQDPVPFLLKCLVGILGLFLDRNLVPRHNIRDSRNCFRFSKPGNVTRSPQEGIVE